MATAWSSYQGARWGGVQSTEYSRASALRVESTRASAAADQRRAIDIALFIAWIEANATADDRVARFYEDRFREEFKPALEIWRASEPLTNPEAADSPFDLPEYRLRESERATELEAAAEAAFTSGQEANRNSDAYVLNAVLLATVLFFSGIAQQFRIPPLQFTLLTTATVMLTIGLANILILPKYI